MKAASTHFKCLSGPTGQAGAAHRQPGSHTPRRTRLEQAPAYAAGTPGATRLTAPRLTAPHGPSLTLDIVPVLLDNDYAQGGSTALRVLHIDHDIVAAQALAALLMPEAHVTHVPTLDAARSLLERQLFSLVVLDPTLPDGDAACLLPLLARTPLLVYSARQPAWGEAVQAYLPKPWTSQRQLWSTISGLLGIAAGVTAGD